MADPIRKLLVNTGGGDAPGLNAVIRAVVLSALERGIEVWGVRSGYHGMLEGVQNGLIPLDRQSVRGILHEGGSILGTASRGDPFRYPTQVQGQDRPIAVDRSQEIVDRFHRERFDALIAIGGDGSLRLAQQLYKRGIPRVIGVPKTIDNDVWGTELTFGFDTAVGIATEAIDRLHTTAESHDRIMTVEVMGRNAGWIALRAGIAGGADAILIPEIPFDLGRVVEKIRQRERRGRHFSIVVAAEGAIPKGDGLHIKAAANTLRPMARLGGIAEHVNEVLIEKTGKDGRSLVLGHLQRGGGPTTYDRLLALRYGAAAVRFLLAGVQEGMVALRNHSIDVVSLDEVVGKTRTVPIDCDTVVTAREMGICFGDEAPGHFDALTLLPPAAPDLAT